MIAELAGLPDGVTGFSVSGTIVAEDYGDVVLPALERAAATGEVRFLMEISSFDGMTPAALWEDLKIGVEHLRAWKRVAVVTDIDWIHHLTAMFGWMTPGQVRVFAVSDRDAAISWVSA